MKKRLRHIASGLSVAAVLTGQVMASDCMDQRAERADQIRFLQSALMVAALQCKRVPGFKARYNDFVTSNKPQLQQSYNELERWLKRTGNQDIGRHLTSQANRISARTWRARDFCGSMLRIAEEASGPGNLMSYITRLPVSYEAADYSQSCTVRTLTAQSNGK